MKLSHKILWAMDSNYINNTDDRTQERFNEQVTKSQSQEINKTDCFPDLTWSLCQDLWASAALLLSFTEEGAQSFCFRYHFYYLFVRVYAMHVPPFKVLKWIVFVMLNHGHSF